MDIHELFSETIRLKASDLHLIVGYPPMLRIDGKLIALDGTSLLTGADTEQLLYQIIQGERKDLLLTNKEIDFSLATQSARLRANVYVQQGTLAADFRLIPSTIRSIDELGLPAICHQFAKLRQGFVLVTGPTGHGKSTTLAAMIQKINETQAHHVVTIEDPIEYVYPRGLSIISQREMHEDSHSWNVALRSVLREDPDVVLIGEMRDLETIAAAITIAETGHLVFATLHTNSAAQSVDRIVDVFPEQQQAQVRMQLSGTLEAIISQRLMPQISGRRTLAYEIMLGTTAIKTVVREGKTHLIDNIIQTSSEAGMAPLEVSLAQLIRDGKITYETGREFAIRPDELTRLVNR